MFGRLLAVLTVGLCLTSCGEKTPMLIEPDDFSDAKGDADDVGVGIVGMPPCRSLRTFNQDLNLQAAGNHAGTVIGLTGGGQVFAVVFAKSATPPSADDVVSEVPELIERCTHELEGDPSRRIAALDDVPQKAVGYRGEENTVTTEYAYISDADGRLLVVGAEHRTTRDTPSRCRNSSTWP